MNEDVISYVERVTDARISRGRGRSPYLTDRELEVIHLVSLGLTNSEIAPILSVSTETVKSHVRNVLAKTNARNRTHAIAMMLREGTIT